ncbi:P-loop containing nucleoside triphosphate hydrolase protein [Cylindrobasidium torrendii FP15055 ss-10]|uniref:p-loop containing nucleoside triphosphate hydrolase protein n=1 Tax=Cylindrobasidium torrendii FP15055 ss-10 TaxID=1314674 RepID=A0A0D7BJZ0_9AGAR|nr:P-loop containing nucleoside triphosphate hydrolase protein [Cylindrobasidium torrendii FP15055 ss-10]
MENGNPSRDRASPTHGQVMLILVGLIGSGKSTFAEALQSFRPEFVRCNQDDLGNRREVEFLARRSLAQGKSVVIDRTNFDESQRSTWVGIAKELPGTLIWVLVFDTPYDVCASRLRERTGHPTIHTPEKALDVLARFSKDFTAPQSWEGYDKCFSLSTTETPLVYTLQDVERILEKARSAKNPVVAERPSQLQQTPSRGREGRGGRGYGRGSFSGGGYGSSHSGGYPGGRDQRYRNDAYSGQSRHSGKGGNGENEYYIGQPRGGH